MGMYNDFGRNNRDDWSYTYMGSDLLEAAKKKLKEYKELELSLRKKIANRMNDDTQSITSKDSDNDKREIERVAAIAEQCQVWVHEFKRKPDREFNLKLGDVTFFDLHISDAK